MRFDDQVGGIEDGIIALLSFLYKKPDNPDGYLKQIASYGGELDEKQIKQAIDQLFSKFPLMLVAYGDGVDTEVPATSAVLGEPRIFRHDCDFMIVAASDNARGEKQQRRGVYQMIADIREALSGVRFARRADPESMVVTVPNRPLPAGDDLLNLDPLKPVGVEYMVRAEGVTAYAQRFETYFKWTEPNRQAPGVQVEELIFDLETLNQVTSPGGKPGVELE